MRKANTEENERKEEKILLNIYYGKKLFLDLFNRPDVWDEIESYLSKNQKERGEEILTVPDFDKSTEILEALKKLKEEEPSLIKKLFSDGSTYEQLRKEFFETEYNLSQIK